MDKEEILKVYTERIEELKMELSRTIDNDRRDKLIDEIHLLGRQWCDM